MLTIGEQIKIQRESRGWSQQVLAERLKISRQSISTWEQGTTLPSFANVLLLSDTFNVTIDELIRGDDRLVKTLKRPVTAPLGLIAVSGLGIAIPLAIGMLSLGVSVATMTDWVQTPVLVGVLVLMGLIYRQQRQRSAPLTRVVIGLAIVILALLLLPQMADVLIGFGDGLRTQG